MPKDSKDLGVWDSTSAIVHVLFFAAKYDHFNVCENPRDLETRELQWLAGELCLEIHPDDPTIAHAFKIIIPDR